MRSAWLPTDQGITFPVDQVVNDTQPIFYYCGTPTHCEKGMFGIINPPQASNPSNSVAGMMPAMAQNVGLVLCMLSVVLTVFIELFYGCHGIVHQHDDYEQHHGC